jgi:hypothetical protein
MIPTRRVFRGPDGGIGEASAVQPVFLASPEVAPVLRESGLEP